MYLFKLIKDSLISSFITRPIKLLQLFILCLFGIKKWSFFNDKKEDLYAANRLSLYKTIYFNIRSLPFHQAIIFPIHIYTGTQIISSSGKVEIKDVDVSYGMIKWGWFHSFRSQGKTRIQNRGKIIFRGKGKLLSGSEISIWPDACLNIGDSFFVGENVLIYCQNSIYLGKSVTISYQCDISDSDFHYCIDVTNGKVYDKNKPIIIGDYNWIGNRTSIKKGTKTPAYILVASAGCVLCKDYTRNVSSFSVLGGCPAKVLKTDTSRIWHNELETIKAIDEIWNREAKLQVPLTEIDKYIHL